MAAWLYLILTKSTFPITPTSAAGPFRLKLQVLAIPLLTIKEAKISSNPSPLSMTSLKSNERRLGKATMLRRPKTRPAPGSIPQVGLSLISS